MFDKYKNQKKKEPKDDEFNLPDKHENPDKTSTSNPTDKKGCDNDSHYIENGLEDGLTEEEVDEALEETFPASDPPSWSPGQATVC